MKARTLGQLAGPSLLALGVWFALGWLPSQSAAADLRLLDAESELTLLSAELSDARSLEAELPGFTAEIDTAEAAVPMDKNVAGFVRATHRAAVTSEVVLDQIAPLGVSSDTDPESVAPLPTGTSSISISIGATGAYPGLVAFVDALVADDRLVLVDSIEMRSDEADSSIVILDLEVRIFTTENLISVSDFGFDEDDEFLADDTEEES